MSSSHAPTSSTPLGRAINTFEETAIAVMLGAMTVITFANVVARYVFNANILWALEATVFLFAWLVLFGISHCVKITAHIGVDIVLNMVSARKRQFLSIFAALLSLTFALLLLKGGWDYWHRFATKAAFLETNDIPMPFFLAWLADVTNDGEAYEKIPRYIPYAILPISMVLFSLRFIQAAVRLVRGDIDRIIANHEAEEMVDDAVAAREAAEQGASHDTPARPGA